MKRQWQVSWTRSLTRSSTCQHQLGIAMNNQPIQEIMLLVETTLLGLARGGLLAADRRIELENSVSVLTNEISEIRPAIQQAIDGMVNRLLEDDDSTMMRQNIIANLEDMPGLTRYQVINAASTLSRDENRRDLQFYYRLPAVEDRLYFILHNILKV
ncbi:hypothetical protein LINPERPRIM_LOCUS435 [Linum perenne]